MTLPALPPLPFLTTAPLIGLRSTLRQVVAPRVWTALSWDSSFVDTHEGFDPDAPTGWSVRRDGLYIATAPPFELRHREDLVFSFAVLIDGLVREDTVKTQVLRGPLTDKLDRPGPQRDRAPVVSVLDYAAGFGAITGARCSLGVWHSATGALELAAVDWGTYWVSHGEDWSR